MHSSLSRRRRRRKAAEAKRVHQKALGLLAIILALAYNLPVSAEAVALAKTGFCLSIIASEDVNERE